MSPRNTLRTGHGRIAVIGAGIRGLVSAGYLKGRGYAVRIFDKADSPGGIWRQVYASSVINTPAHGYTFHPGNIWQEDPTPRNEILANIDRLVAEEALGPLLRMGQAVDHVVHTPKGRWLVGNDPEPYDGVLVCTGFLGANKLPAAASISKYSGQVLPPYAFEENVLFDRNVVIVGSGSTALEMLMLAESCKAKQATLVVRPGTEIRDNGRAEYAKFWVSSNPFIYSLTKRGAGHSAAVAPGITRVLASERTSVIEGEFAEASGHKARLADGRKLPADLIVWCTGWNSPTPAWVAENRSQPTLVTAMCPRCLDTSGFGFGSSSIHAKVLDAILSFGLDQAFDASNYGCDCESEPTRHGPHIISSAMRFLLAQPDGVKILSSLVAEGWRSNMHRFRTAHEPRWVSMMSFFNAPLGL
ncbi:MAG: FAD-dependent oxidoreductase [Gammaproteobacteria bacterium]